MRYALRAGALALALAAGLTAPAHAGEPLPGASLEELLALARERNPEYASQRHEADAAGQRVVPAGNLPDPRLRTEWMDVTQGGQQNPTLAPNRVGSVRYTLMQDLPWYGKRDLRRDIAALEAEGARGRVTESWADLTNRVKTAYTQSWYVAGSLSLTRELLDLMVRLERVARTRYAAGLAAQQDVIRAQVEQTNLKNDLLGMEKERRQVQARLNALLLRPATAPLAEPERLRPLAAAKLDYAQLESRVRAHNPQLFIEEARLQAAEKTRDLTYRNRYPDVTVGIVPNQVQNGIKQWDVMLELNIPLRQSTRRAQEQEAESMLSAARTKKEALANQLLADLGENLAGLEAARDAERLATTSLMPQAELTFQAALAGYETGKVDFATLLDAQRQIRQARQNQLKAQADGQMRLADIERLLGEEL